jgi:hypothetical protein
MRQDGTHGDRHLYANGAKDRYVVVERKRANATPGGRPPAFP